MAGVVLKNSFTQPGTVASALLLQNLPDFKEERSRELTVFPYIYQKADAKGGRDICALATKINGGTPDDSVINFKGSDTQIYNVYRHVIFESFAKSVYEGGVSLKEAEGYMASVRAREGRETPLLVTTDKIFVPPHLSNGNDYHGRHGPVYDFYAQNWKDGLARAQEKMTDDEHGNEDFQAIIAAFEHNEYDTVYPTFFFAQHRFANHQENAYDFRSVFDIYLAGPHELQAVTSVNNETAAYIALSLLNDGFIGHKVDEDPRQKQLRIFNTLHYDEICAQETKYMDGVKKSHLLDSIIAQRGLS